MPSTEAKLMVSTNGNNTVHVAVGVIIKDGCVLLAKRATHQHQGGLWEFPGGKVELNEHVIDALIRELNEELAITATRFHPLIQIRHDYGDKTVLLDVWKVTDFSGEPLGQEGQPLQWVPLSQLKNYEFPAANKPIVQAASLPQLIAITPSQGNKKSVLAFCEHAFAMGARGFQIRSPQLSASDVMWVYQSVNNHAAFISQRSYVWLNSYHLFDQPIASSLLNSLSGIHLAARHVSKLAALKHLTLNITTSCHNLAELKHAQYAGINAAYYSPLMKTASHPDQESLGWSLFANHVAQVAMPVYGLGGLKVKDLLLAQGFYAQGIAGISMFAN